MSHIVTIATEVRDPVAVACRRLSLPEHGPGIATLFDGQASGMLVKLPSWRYPVVADVATGTLRYDNFGGSRGRPEQLDGFSRRTRWRRP